ncbi:unnamed protein product, partial [Ilex paraguariensis]
MERVQIEFSGIQKVTGDPLPFARRYSLSSVFSVCGCVTVLLSLLFYEYLFVFETAFAISGGPCFNSYQLEALEKAIKQNTIVFLETGSGKTLIAIMLLRSYAYLLRKPLPYIAVFLVPTVVLVTQQAEAVKMNTDLKVGKYWGEMGVDYWDAATWKQQRDEYEVLVMTPAILLDALRRSFLKLDMIKVLIFDECHNARGRHPYACIMMEFYHRQLASNHSQLPRIFGMTASPIKAKGSSSGSNYWKQISELENLMNSK